MTPSDRLEKLIEVAARCFVNQGFQRTQMDDVALELGVSKGTIYRAVESKEALLAAVLVYGDDITVLRQVTRLETAAFATISADLTNRLATALSALKLSAVLESDAVGTDHNVQDLALDTYQMLHAHRVRIMVLDRCAPELPALAGEWYDAGRYVLVDLWLQYLKSATGLTSTDSTNTGPANASTATIEKLEVVARSIVELLTLWAVKMPWDPQPRSYSPQTPTIVGCIVSNVIETTIAGFQTEPQAASLGTRRQSTTPQPTPRAQRKKK